MPLQATSGAASYDAFGGGLPFVPTYIEDVFNTYLWTGNGSSQTITNNIDLSGKGGMVWIKSRSNARNNLLFDTSRGATQRLFSNLTLAQSQDTQSLTAFNANGFSVGSDSDANASAWTYAGWSFREQPKFFDVVTYTGNGVGGNTISHNLGSVPGCIIFKRTDSTSDWSVYHRSLSGFIVLNSTSGETGSFDSLVNNITSTSFSVQSSTRNNANGGTYVAYLFAHNAGGFGLTGTDNVISCGSYTGSGGTATVTLGYEPQWVLIKQSNAGGDWYLFDNMRGIVTGGTDPVLFPNNANAEDTGSGDIIDVTATGFNIKSTLGGSGDTYIYIAIRRGPMKTPTSGTSVFAPIAAANSTATQNTTGFPVDLQISKLRNTGGEGPYDVDRLRGVSTNNTGNNARNLITSSTGSEGADTNTLSLYWNNTGFQTPNYYGGSDPAIYWNFRRAPGFFDEVCYTGNGTSGRTVTHNLTVAPELIIARQRTGGDWYVYSSGATATKYLVLNATDAAATDSSLWNNTAPTSSVFTLGDATGVNRSNTAFVSYLFASCPGVSKVGSYTGNGSSQTINCGFTGGARFVMIKRTDSTGDWYVWDTARGIVSGNDPHLSLNTTAAEVTSNDTIDTDSTGFVVNQVSATNVNVSSATYIYLAIA
jgi:hypothetical protein